MNSPQRNTIASAGTIQRIGAIRAARGGALLSQREYTAVFEASPDAMLVVGADGAIRDANDQAVTMFGYGRGEIEGSLVERLVP